MENLPQDPYMLLSVVNMKLRDNYSSLTELCDDLDINPESLCDTLAEAGFTYDEENNRFA
ncbi:MAG: DUF4250 domain-containing protein [Muribaculaceae bacterium]|nr:DUF4250 domain-containing protein [Muribaculaceae bacterium]